MNSDDGSVCVDGFLRSATIQECEKEGGGTFSGSYILQNITLKWTLDI